MHIVKSLHRAESSGHKREGKPSRLVEVAPERERAILVAVELKGRDQLWTLEDTLGELRHLAESAGAEWRAWCGSGRNALPLPTWGKASWMSCAT